MGKKGGVIIGTIAPLAGGAVAGVILNDAWEGAFSQGVPLPGYGQKLFDITPTVSVGVDDAFQVGLSLFVAVAGHFMGSSLVKNLGVGMIVGWGAVKAGETMPGVKGTDASGEYFHNPITLIPHRYPPIPAATASATSNAVSDAYFVNAP